jgi:hypothetical protein
MRGGARPRLRRRRALRRCYSPDRKSEHSRRYLAGFNGILQTDGHAGYAGLYERGVTEVACWAHARRKFFDVHAETKSPLASEAMQRIAALYEIEGSIRGQLADDRLAARGVRSVPLFADLRGWLEKTLARVSGKSDLAVAIRYTLSRWQALTLGLRDGRACIGRVDDWRGGGRSQGELFSGGFHPAGALSIRTVAPFPVAARQTGHADFPHQMWCTTFYA